MTNKPHINPDKQKLVVYIALAAVTFFVFWQVKQFDFINIDDYLTENVNIQSGFNQESLKWAFTTTYFSYWHPLTWLSHMLDWSLFGADASGHHLVNLLLHIGSVIFLLLFLTKTTKHLWLSAFAAALFALHPLRVESVAWIAERKDVLSMFFGMACLYAYAVYAEKQEISRYILCLILFAFGLMSKPMLVTLPFVLLLLDYWPLKRWPKATNEPGNIFSDAGRMIGEKVPFILLATFSSIITFWGQSKIGQVASLEAVPFLTRVENVVITYAAYLEKIFWPVNLAVYYPYDFSPPLWKFLISAIIVIAITFSVLYYIRKLPFLFVGWFIYLGTLIPVIGLVQVGTQGMADHYTYLPSIGIAIMFVWGISSLTKNESFRKNILMPAALAILVTLSVLSWYQCGYWKNSLILINHDLEVTQNNYIAHYIRGCTYANLGRYQSAIEDFNRAIDLNPGYRQAFVNRGVAYEKLNDYQRAIEDYNKAIRLKPDFVFAYYNRGVAYLLQSNSKQGCMDARKACALGSCKLLETAKDKSYCH